MSTDPVPSLALPAPATAAPTPTSSAVQPAPSTSSSEQQQQPQTPTATTQKNASSISQQPAPPHQQQQNVTANHPASIAAAATVALSATLLDPNEWNALASTSMVTLDDLRTAFLEQRQQQLKDLERTHRESLRELLFMSETYDKADVAGSPWKLGQTLQVAEDDAREHVKTFLDQYHLSLDIQKSIQDHVLEQPKAIRELVAQELKTGPVELAPPPTPTSATAPSAGEAQRDRDLRKEVEQSNFHRSQAVALAAAAVQARAIAEGVAKIKPLNITAAESQGVRVAPLQPGQVPSFVIESTTPIAPIASSASAAAVTDLDAEKATSQAAAETAAATPVIKIESSDKAVSSPSKASNALERAVSPVSGLARNAATQSTGLRIPPSPMVVPTVPETIPPPLHPTLQVLAPNPLSVTYAASLRPLPPDPTRRITGAGVSGGAIHHRSGRKISSLSNHSNVNSYSSIAAAKIGPAGSGQADLYRWYVRARASPGAGMVGKADKCLMTSDWKVAFNEQRFVRAMARIEKLKAQGEWSFRQPKKQKGPVVRKAHWDHLLEEMKWLQTDFREERRWKMAVAFHLAHEVAAWHRARTTAERAAFCVSVPRPYRHRTVSDNIEQRAASDAPVDEAIPSSHPLEAAAEAMDEDEAMPDETPVAAVQSDKTSTSANKVGTYSATSANAADVTMEGEGDADDAVAQAVDDALETTNEAASARAEEMGADGEDDDADADADDVEAATAALVSGEPAKPPKVEVVREPLAQPERMPTLVAAPEPTATSTAAASATSKDTQAADDKLAHALRSEPKDAESTLTAELPPQLLATLRAPIFSTSVTTTVVSPAALLESLDPEAAAALLGIEVSDLSNAADLLSPGSLSFSKMFPELPLYAGVSVPDANSKSDRRWDEGSLNQPPRLTHVTKLLDSRPLLVSTLEPSKNRANGRWLPDSDWIVAAEQSDPLRGVIDGSDAGLPPMPGSLLFARKSNRAPKETSGPASSTPAEPAQPDVRAAMFAWTPDEDNYLMTLAKQYHNNWPLVADLFNSTRLNTTTDKREPWDCYDRCKRIEQAAAEGKPPPGPPQLPPTAADTDKDGKKGDGKDGDASSSKRDKLNKKLSSKYDGSKRKLRRSNLMEVMRKSAKRREAGKQAQQTQQTKKVNLNTHETHAQIKAGPAITPQSLSALKTERDQAALRQYYEQQRAQLAYQQQQQQQQRLLAQQAQAQRMAQQQGTGSTPGQAGAAPTQAGKAAVATAAGGVNGAGNLTLPPGSTPASQPGTGVQQKAAPNQQVAPQQHQQQTAQIQQQQQQQPAQQQQQQQQVQAQLQSQLQASQAAQMQNLYAQIQQQQRQQQQTQQLGQAAGLGQVRPAVGPLTQQQLATLTPQQQQQYHAQLAAATAAAAQQQQLRNQMAAVAAAQQGAQAGAGGVQDLPFSMPNAQAQFQLMQQQQQQQPPQQNAMPNQPRPPHLQQAQAQAQAAALQLYQQQQRQAAQVQAQAQMRPPQTAQQQQQQFVRPANNGQRPPPVPTAAGQNKPGQQQQARPPTPTNGAAAGTGSPGVAAAAAPGMPATVQALQQQLAISLATSNLSPEQINGLAIQLYKQAQQQQQQQQQQQAAAAGGQSPISANRTMAQAGARPPQQILNQAIQALAAQNQKSQGAKPGAAQARPPTPRPT
ncbi:conserved hypothetical protein [Sporisorium reilianum SRZ2]|uniref:Vacuolar import and degradation protein 21 n=1 Tax=Sporisorium reilianum (strain SRZ2) TaxID=999809 RepID=E6ZUJ0_SPORE|nr:conserved hypothetical protein [Sporisorium reilianum SRZ2]